MTTLEIPQVILDVAHLTLPDVWRKLTLYAQRLGFKTVGEGSDRQSPSPTRGRGVGERASGRMAFTSTERKAKKAKGEK